MKSYEYFDEAEAELEHALTESVAMDPATASEFRQAVDGVLRDIRGGLLVAAIYPRTECREHPMTRFPYSIVYLDDPDAIRVVAFAHHKRRPGYWKSRLRHP